jgi:hypothetical protein
VVNYGSVKVSIKKGKENSKSIRNLLLYLVKTTAAVVAESKHL